MSKRCDVIKIEMKIHREDLENYCNDTFQIWKNSYYRPTKTNGRFSDSKWRLVKKYLKLKIETHIKEILTDDGWGLDFLLFSTSYSDWDKKELMMMSNKELKTTIRSLEDGLKDNSVPLERNGRWD
jgi:hypothetical protein